MGAGDVAVIQKVNVAGAAVAPVRRRSGLRIHHAHVVVLVLERKVWVERVSSC